MAAMITNYCGTASNTPAYVRDIGSFNETQSSSLPPAGKPYKIKTTDLAQGSETGKHLRREVSFTSGRQKVVQEDDPDWRTDRLQMGEHGFAGGRTTSTQSGSDQRTLFSADESVSGVAYKSGMFFAGYNSDLSHQYALQENAMHNGTPDYPASLVNEYDVLTDKKYTMGLSRREALRLREMKAMMDAIDRATPLVQINKQRMDENFASLAALDQELKDLLKERRKNGIRGRNRAAE